LKISAIICEYNPFHNGHKYQIQNLKSMGYKVVCLMSGNFVQRGEMAIFNKHKRSELAILNGADLVLELPLTYSLSSGERFCFNSVRMLDSLNIIDSLCFGCEDSDYKLEKIAEFLLDKDIKSKLKFFLKSGISYPTATVGILRESLGEGYANVAKKPNNILAIEYIKALMKLDSKISTIKLNRHLVGHHGTCNSNMASATQIRKLIGDCNKYKEFVPYDTLDIYKSLISDENYIDKSKEKFLMLGHLKRLNSEYFSNILDVGSGFNNKIENNIKTSVHYDELVNKLADKIHTKARVRRILMNSYLGIDKNVFNDTPNFLRVLATNDNGLNILKKIKEKSTIKVSHSLLKCDDKNFVNIVNNSTNLYNFCLYSPQNSSTEFTTSLVKINNIT